MPYTLKPNKIYARDNDGSSYLPQNVITDRTTAEDIELWRTATADIKADANAAVSQARTDVDKIAAAVAAMVDLGTDTTLSTSKMAADAKATGDAVSDLKSAMNDNFKDPFDVGSVMLFNRYNVSDGYIYTDGSVRASTTLCYTNDFIPVTSGKTIYFSDDGVAQPARIVTAYDSTKAVLPDKGLDYGNTYTVPSGVSYIKVSFLKSYNYFQGQYDRVGETKSYYTLKDEALPESVIQMLSDVAELKQSENSLNSAVFETKEVKVAEDGSASTSTTLGTTQRWFFPNAIPAGYVFDKIGFTVNSTYSSNNTPIVIEFFDNNNGSLSLKKSISKLIPTSEAGEYYEIDCESYKSEKETYIAFGQGRSMLSYTAGTGTILYIADKSSETLNLSALSSFGGHLNIDILCNVELTKFSPKAVNVIEIGEGLDFEEIQQALDSVDDSLTNPYTFIIYPKETPYSRFSMIRKLTESYPWSNAPIRYISMIGIDKYRCIIEDDTGDYSAPPAEILTNGIIKNLTFVASKSNQSATASQGAYAVHIDAEPVGNVGYDMRFEDCIFKSDQTAGVGIGLHNNCQLAFKNCEFISTASESYNPHSGYTNLAYLGSFNCHSSTNANDANQELTLIDCIGISKEVSPYNMATNANCYMTVKAFGNTFWCEGTSQANGYKGSYALIYGANHGNNSTQLNAQ